MLLVKKTIIVLIVSFAAFAGLYAVYGVKRNSSSSRKCPYEDDDDYRMVVKTQINDDSQPSGSKTDNLMIILKNNSFLIVLCVFTWIGYFVRTIPVGSISHVVYIAILMCVIHVVTLKFCHVHIRWFRGVVSVTAEVNMGFLPKFKISRKYQFTGEARVCR